jgi:hypothetical protein
MFKQGDPEMDAFLKAYEDDMQPKGYTTRELGMTYPQRDQARKNLYQAENDYINEVKGLPIPNGAALDQIIKDYELSDKHHKAIRELIMADDPVSKIKAFLKKIPGTKIADAISILFPQYGGLMREIVRMLVGNPTSVLSDVDPRSTPFTKPVIVSKLPNQDYLTQASFQTAVDSAPEASHFDDVAYDGLATIVCPEKFKFRLYVDRALSTALVQGSALYTVSSDANGNAFIMINPSNPGAVAAAGVAPCPPAFFYATLTGYVPDTGVYTNYANSNGPLINNLTSLRALKVNGFSVKVYPIVSSLNNSGIYRSAYVQNYNNFGLASGSTDIQLGTIALNQFFTEKSLSAGYMRNIYLTDNNDILDVDLVTQVFSDGFIYVFSNCAVNTQVATIEVTYVYEAMPSQSAKSIMSTGFPTKGPATVEVLASAMLSNPLLQSMPLELATKLGKDIFDKGHCLRYSQAVKILSESTTNYLDHNKANMGQIQHIDNASEIDDLSLIE